jgi:hypothetical protein
MQLLAGDTGYKNEAFKVDEEKAIPSSPAQIDYESKGLQEKTPEADAYIEKEWKSPSHEPLST